MKNIVTKIKSIYSFFTKTIAKGFFFYFYQIFNLLEKIFKNSSFIKKNKNFFKAKEENFASFLFVSIIILILLVVLNINGSKDIINENKSNNKDIINSTNDTNDTFSKVKENVSKNNLFKKYETYNLDNIDFLKLKEENPDIVAWLYVEDTNINYPIVQTTDNEFYLNNNIQKKSSSSGWTFMDYRNSKMMSDNNTIFYGHNLLNKTAFGSISNIFTKDWYDNSKHKIIVLTDIRKYTYEIFSCYYTGEEKDYLQYNFYSDEEYETFLNSIKKKSKFKFKVSVSTDDNIITLSTCTEDNKGRKVVHAKVVNSELY